MACRGPSRRPVMILLTDEQRGTLLANGCNPDADHVPVVKLFNPLGPGVWLAVMLDADGETLWGIADLDCDYVEFGPFNIAELSSLNVGLGLGIKRDICLRHTPLAAWIHAPSEAGSIRGAERIIARLERQD